MKTTFILIVLLQFCMLTGCKDKKKAEVVETPPVLVEDTIKPQPVVEVKEEKTVRNEVQRYFLIAGCFEYKELADKLCDKLQKAGYDSKIMPYFENLYLVSYNGYPTRQEALTALNEIRKEKGKEKTWMYKP